VIDLAALRDRFLSGQIAGDRREAMRLVLDEGLALGAEIVELQAHVVQAAQNELGRLWQQNRVSIAQEHIATEISQLTLSALYERATPKPSLGKRVLIACVEGELHDLPARLVADVLDLDGFDVRYLGANVPHETLLTSIAHERPDLIGLSVTMTFHVPALRTAVERVRAMTATPILIGGHATRWSQNLAFELEVDSTGTSHDEITASARRLAGVAP
jgi:methanogenic corrinoid protein MtbC1